MGPGDLRLSMMGEGGADNEEPEFFEALDKIQAAAKANNLICGIHNATVAYSRRMIERGFHFVTVQSDGGILSRAAKDIVAGLREEEIPTTEKKDVY